MTGNDLLSRFRGCRVLVVGDLMLDEFVWGQVNRISPEAPVPVVEVTRRSSTPGGAANTAANIGSLGGEPVLAGVIGDDAGGTRVCELLRDLGVETAPVVRDPGRPTTTKTRVIAHSQQVVRIDHEAPGPVAAAVRAELLDRIAAALPAVRGCVVSDYGKGVVTPDFVGQLIARARAAGVPIVVDPKGTDYVKYRGATLVKPNQLEAGKVLNRDLRTDPDVDTAGTDLLELLGPDTSVLVTRGAHGMSLFEHARQPVHIPAQAREVYDVTGAGDTVAGTLALSLAVGGDLEAACRLASLAAAIVVGKVGTATCSFEELKAAQQVVKW
ncbi:D-glycero-beta-D-manno-heptose-7-phosphate kinase [Fimbriiglobus ruber]|uniref:ADP-heptose synthase n=1 Tax=Fimbriiglobus ruber TaxID=1908690 RepID=A0A225DEU6_9BACT|nr:D-glycero-beta-D-manno-heptose-7-phosphate kinase [Fimbriiglobus ruber]OWK35856.1 ADP-heptose synthase [Fimbriiglobus ruber]